MRKAGVTARGRCYAEVELSAIGENLSALSAHIPKKTLKMAVVKANAYGHGALPIAEYLSGRVDFFGVATAAEAAALRSGGIRDPILVLSFVPAEDYREMVEMDVTLTVSEPSEARELSRVAVSIGKRARIHIPVDTGMGRIGLFPDCEGLSAVREIFSLRGLIPEGIFSHYSTADMRDKSAARHQAALFTAFLAELSCRGIRPPLAHISASAASAEMDTPLDMCRLGISLYGYRPSAECDRDALRLTPALSLYSRVVQVKRQPRGSWIGYGRAYRAPSDILVATVSAGYADGYPRSSLCTREVLIRGCRLPIIGRVCMDQLMVDLTPIGGAEVGERVVLLGREGDEEITAVEIAERSGGFHYELLTSVSSRVPRFYITG